MTKFRYNPVLIAFIVLGLLSALTIDWQRHIVEENNKCVELVMDYEDITELAYTEGVPVRQLMQQFKAAGITSLAVYETTLEKLYKNGKLTVLSGADILSRVSTGTALPAWAARASIGPDTAYILGEGQVFEETKSDLIRRLGPERVVERPEREGTRRVLEIKANYDKVIKWNLGLPTDEMQAAVGQGFYVVVRPTNYTQVKPEDVNAVFSRLKAVDNVSGIMFVGDEVLGYPDLVPMTAELMKASGLTLHMIEHPLQLQFVKQDGLMQLAALNNYQAARVYVIPKDEQPKLKIDEAVHRWVLTDEERNIRVNLLRKYDKPEAGKTLIETNLSYVSAVKNSLEAKGFTIGRAGTYQPYFPAPLLLVLVTVGATAAGVLYLSLLRPFAAKYQYLLFVLISLLLAFPLIKGGGTLVRQAAALVSAILFPVLSMTWQFDRWRTRAPASGRLGRIIADGLLSVTLTVLLSLIGGLYVAALLGDVRFLLEMEIYRGVKLTFVAPLLLISLVYLTRFDLFQTTGSLSARSVGRQVVKLLNYPVQLKTLLAFAVAAFVAWVFVGRSGHTAGVPVPAIELKLRSFLETAMYARPREKEFLIGHPAFFLAVMAIYRKWPQVLHYVLVIAATIGQGSLVETFAHARTPVFMSFVRALDGLAVGALIGIIAVIAVQLLHYLSFVLGRSSAAK